MRILPSPRRGVSWKASLTALGLIAAGWPTAVSARTDLLDDNGRVIALVVGIDRYGEQRRLEGAVADAKDLQRVLQDRARGSVTTLLDEAATDEAVRKALARAGERAGANDLFVFAFSGLGNREPRAGGQTASSRQVLLLAPADRGKRGNLSLQDLSKALERIARRGARVLVVLDTSFGGTLQRAPDPRLPTPTYRYAGALQVTEKAVRDGSDGLGTGRLPNSVILMASDLSGAVPEVDVPNALGKRGALSYAVARALEGQADIDRDGAISGEELLSYVDQVSRQLTDQRQLPLVTARTRGWTVVPKGQKTPFPGSVSEGGPAETIPRREDDAATVPLSTEASPRVTIALLGSLPASAYAIPPGRTEVRFVGARDKADFTWDPVRSDALVGSDVIATGITERDIPALAERVAAQRSLKLMSTARPETVQIRPDDRRFKLGQPVSVRVGSAGRRFLVAFNLAGDGSVQYLYPVGDDAKRPALPFSLPEITVRPPFGADTVVVITSDEDLGELEKRLVPLDQTKSALDAVRAIQDAAPGSRVGFSSVFTGP